MLYLDQYRTNKNIKDYNCVIKNLNCDKCVFSNEIEIIIISKKTDLKNF